MRLIAIVLVASLPATAIAQTRLSTTGMSCSSASALVSARHAVVLSTGGQTYDRFVSDQSQCPVGQVTLPGFAPAADNAQCLVGWRCIDLPRNEK
jgi:hypothetical protein